VSVRPVVGPGNHGWGAQARSRRRDLKSAAAGTLSWELVPGDGPQARGGGFSRVCLTGFMGDDELRHRSFLARGGTSEGRAIAGERTSVAL